MNGKRSWVLYWLARWWVHRGPTPVSPLQLRAPQGEGLQDGREVQPVVPEVLRGRPEESLSRRQRRRGLPRQRDVKLEILADYHVRCYVHGGRQHGKALRAKERVSQTMTSIRKKMRDGGA